MYGMNQPMSQFTFFPSTGVLTVTDMKEYNRYYGFRRIVAWLKPR